MRFLVDTNVFLDFFIRTGPEKEEAKNFFISCRRLKNEIYVTSMSLRDIGYIAHGFCHNNEMARNIQCSVYGLVTKVCDTSADAAIDALYSENSDFEDQLQIDAAMEILADAIVTNDKKGFKKAGLHVFTPKQANELMSKQHPVRIE